jgi:Flp pilus assembly protein TadG
MQRAVKSRGQDLVEYALVVPFLLMALLMIFDLGRATYAYSVLFNAVREGGRYASVNSQAANKTTLVTNYIHTRVPGLEPADVSISINWIVTPGKDIPDRVTIILTYPFDVITPFIGSIIGADPWIIDTTATMNLET